MARNSQVPQLFSDSGVNMLPLDDGRNHHKKNTEEAEEERGFDQQYRQAKWASCYHFQISRTTNTRMIAGLRSTARSTMQVSPLRAFWESIQVERPSFFDTPELMQQMLFEEVHPIELLDEYLTPENLVGKLDPRAKDKKKNEQTIVRSPPMATILSIEEMERLALERLSPKALAYYASGTDDEITKVANGTIFKSILLRPRVFIDCTHCSLSTTLLGNRVGMPIFVSPAAMAKLAHPSGEIGIAKACSRFNALQIISKNASISVADIVRAGPNAVFGWQLYVLKDIKATERTLAQILAIPQIKFIVFDS
ncbi:hypothetical protein CEP52_014794 [Fusarium oligoseptatum]|uniref:FMN hydroxy acid dehydrogenase domain-containing protein n=1 Tax=Fusarium oligoseptatum TaxID=2604345 RepID=A0A428SJ29_9HYPO|nr:hypothetical protein CEP52_014794 [Fusarium oligoseptatum]